jgi:hypothetical protein
MGAQYVDFGKKPDGYNLFHIHGAKQEVEKAIQKLIDLGIEIKTPYTVERAAPHINCMYSDYMAVIHVWIPEEMEEK